MDYAILSAHFLMEVLLMKQELYYISPRVVEADCVQEIAIKGRFPHSDLRGFQGEFTIDSVRADGLFTNNEIPGFTSGNGYDLGRPDYEEIKDVSFDADGVLRFRYPFAGEGENYFRVRIADRVLFVFGIFSLRKEYLALRPFKGDMHLHSGFSACCGEKNYLSPEYYAAANRAAGLDFMGLSDHKQHFPSRKAQDFVEQCPTSFVAYPSEEVHLPDLHTIHNLNFGGSKPISCRLFKGQKEYDTIYAHYMSKVPAYPDPYLRHLAANYHVIHDWVHEAGGINVFCHPYWRPHNRLFLPAVIRDYALEHNLYDCIELYNDEWCVNEEAQGLYLELCIKAGKQIPVVGNTDSHNQSSISKNYTVIFAAENTLSALRDSLLQNRNVAVTTLGCTLPHATGNWLWVSYYHFLRKNYFDRHDYLCRKEGDLLFKTLETGEPDLQYDPYLRRPYKEKIDGTEEMKHLTFTPDQAAFSALRREQDALEKEFWK